MIAEYAEKVTEVLRRMESGVYGVVDKGGLRSFKVRALFKVIGFRVNSAS